VRHDHSIKQSLEPAVGLAKGQDALVYVGLATDIHGRSGNTLAHRPAYAHEIPMTAPIRSMPELPVVRTMQDVVDVFRIMKEYWSLTNDFCDEVGGLTRGHTDKVLGPSEDKRLGYDTFALFMELSAIEFVPRLNPDALKRMEAVWEKRERPLYPNA